MALDLDDLLAANGGVLSRAAALQVLSRHTFDNLVKRGRLVAVFPRAYCAPWDLDDVDVRDRAALVSVGGDAALSHTSTLRRRGLPVPGDAPIHVTAYNPRHPRGTHGLVVHRTLLPLDPVLCSGLATVRLEPALITSWPLLSGPDQRAPMIRAAQQRLVGAGRLRDAAERMWWVRGIDAARELVTAVLAGCESELELWGYTDVFAVPELSDATRQLWITVDGARYRLDMAYADERLDVELDGRKYHADRAQWQRDITRDRALARAGWQTVRFSHDDLRDVERCRREVLTIRAARRRAA